MKNSITEEKKTFSFDKNFSLNILCARPDKYKQLEGISRDYDEIINTGSIDSIKFAVNGLKAQYETANGYEGTMVTGKPPKETQQDAFRSQAELVRAMSDPKYDNDPAYRQDVIAKLERSHNLEF